MHFFILQGDLAFRGLIQRPQDMQQGAFPGPRWTYDAHDLSFFYIYVYPLQDPKIPVIFLYSLGC